MTTRYDGGIVRRHSASAAVLVALLGACSSPAPSAVAPPPPASTTSTAPPPPAVTSAEQLVVEPPPPTVKVDDPDEILAPFEIDARRPIRRVYYSWTTREQAADLAKTKKLLVKGPKDMKDLNVFEDAVKAATALPLSHRISTALSKPPLDKRRYAFQNAVGWAQGIAGKPYGTVVVRITLRPEAVLLSLGGEVAPLLSPYAAWDLEGKAVDGKDVEAHPERIAGVLHVSHDPSGAPFREVVLVNEGMIASWEIGTDEVMAELRDEAKALRKVVPLAPDNARINPQEVGLAWVGDAKRPASAAWNRVLGIGTAPYAFGKAEISAIAKLLESADKPEALRHEPPPAKALKLPKAPPVVIPPDPPRPPPRPPRRRPPIMI